MNNLEARGALTAPGSGPDLGTVPRSSASRGPWTTWTIPAHAAQARGLTTRAPGVRNGGPR